MLDLTTQGEVARVRRELLLAADENCLKPHEQLWLWVTADAFVLISRFNAEANELLPELGSRTYAERIALRHVAKRRLNSIKEEGEWFSDLALSPHKIVCRGLGMSDDSIQRLEEQMQKDLRSSGVAWRKVLTELTSVGRSSKVDGYRCPSQTDPRAVVDRRERRTRSAAPSSRPSLTRSQRWEALSI